MESMQNVHSVDAPGEVNYAVGATRVRNANLFDTLANGGHRLEIVRLVAPLNLIELITRIVPPSGKSRRHLSESPRKHTGRISQVYPIGYRIASRWCLCYGAPHA